MSNNSHDNKSKIANLLNKHFHEMVFPDKKKVVSLIITEQQCDELLVHFLAQYYNVDIEEENMKLEQIRNNKDTNEEASEVETSNVDENNNETSENEIPNDESEIEDNNETSEANIEEEIDETSEANIEENEVVTPQVDYSTFTTKVLREKLLERGVTGTSKWVKDRLITKLVELDGEKSNITVKTVKQTTSKVPPKETNNENDEETNEASEFDAVEINEEETDDDENLESHEDTLESLSSLDEDS